MPITKVSRICVQCGRTFDCRPILKQRFCSRACGCKSTQPAKKRWADNKIGILIASFTERDKCWEWRGARDSYGYGKLNRNKAHRLVFEFFYGPITDNQHVLHYCDNPPCVNPSHLFLGSQRDNVQDMINKGRNNRGERQGRAKLTADNIREIRASDEPQFVLADRFHVDRSHISKIRSGLNWKHVA